jgi:hypothetical protein
MFKDVYVDTLLSEYPTNNGSAFVESKFVKRKFAITRNVVDIIEINVYK